MDIVHAQAPAKLNLALAVDQPDASGLHPICSWMVTIDLADDLTITRLPDDRLSRYAILWHEDALRTSDIDWSITSDLAVRAHLAVEQHIGRTLPVQLKLDKRIPVGGGLGGGSSNAAAMIRGLNQLFDLDLDQPTQLAIASTLGSDVPFFIEGGSAIISGLGELVEPMPSLPDLDAVVVLPPFTCSTGRVYAAFDDLPTAGFRPDAVRAAITHRQLFNDLAEPACRVAAELGPLRSQVEQVAESRAHITGSGSAIFVLCDNTLHAETLAAAITERLNLPSLPVRATETPPVTFIETQSR